MRLGRRRERRSRSVREFARAVARETGASYPGALAEMNAITRSLAAFGFRAFAVRCRDCRHRGQIHSAMRPIEMETQTTTAMARTHLMLTPGGRAPPSNSIASVGGRA